jgi:hypothetical protein
MRSSICSGATEEGRAVEGAAGGAAGSDLFRQAEVEQHHVSVVAHEHIGRLEIAVYATGPVERMDRGRQLAGGGVRPGFVVAAPGADAALGILIAGVARRRDLHRRSFVEIDRGGGQAHVAEEVLPAHQLHREEPLILLAVELAEAQRVGCWMSASSRNSRLRRSSMSASKPRSALMATWASVSWSSAS